MSTAQEASLSEAAPSPKGDSQEGAGGEVSTPGSWGWGLGPVLDSG